MISRKTTIQNVAVFTRTNPGFVVMGQKLGKETLMNYIRKFGFGKKTGIDLNGEGNGILFDIDKMGNVELATTAFGQGISVTPIQQITAVSATVNGGSLYTPYVVKGITDPSTNSVIYENKKQKKRKIISEETSAQVRYALESVVALGTGRNAYIENYRVGGKTGTAQKVKDGHYIVGNYILSFIGFIPADEPEIVVYAAVDNAKNAPQYGGTVSAPIVRNIMISSIDILGIKERKKGILKEYIWTDSKYYVVPNVTGKSLKEAQEMLKDFKINYSGKGDKVIYQSPEGGSMQSEDTIINLMLN